MTYSYNLTTDVGRMRRTIPDKVEAAAFWTDEELQSFLDDEGDWRRGAALALETMAADDLIVLKVVQLQNITTNADRVASMMLKRAAVLRKQAEEADSVTGDSFETATIINTDAQYREVLYRDRGGGRWP